MADPKLQNKVVWTREQVLGLLVRAWKNGHADALLRVRPGEADEERRAVEVAEMFVLEQEELARSLREEGS